MSKPLSKEVKLYRKMSRPVLILTFKVLTLTLRWLQTEVKRIPHCTETDSHRTKTDLVSNIYV